MGASRDVGESLIDGDSLDERGEIIEHFDGGIAQPLVISEMAADKDQLRTQLARPPSRHAPADTEVLGFVRCGKHDPAADSDRLTAQRWVNQLLDRGIKGIKVRMEDGGCRFHPVRLPANLRISSREHKENKRPRMSSRSRGVGNCVD
jgi:hypothetical protein